MRVLHGLFAAFLILGFSFSPMPALADAEAQKFLETIYKKYVGQNTPGVSFENHDALLNYFTPQLAAMIAADAERSQRNDEPPTLDGDPFIGAQDWDIQDVTVTVKDTAPGKATGAATFTNMGEKQIVNLDLLRTPKGWRIDEIHWNDGSLRGILSGDVGNDRKELPGTQKL